MINYLEIKGEELKFSKDSKIKLCSPFTKEELDNDSYLSLEIYGGSKDFMVACCDECFFTCGDDNLEEKLFKISERKNISYSDAIENYYENKKSEYLLIKLEIDHTSYSYLFKNTKKLSLTNQELLNNFNPQL